MRILLVSIVHIIAVHQISGTVEDESQTQMIPASIPSGRAMRNRFFGWKWCAIEKKWENKNYFDSKIFLIVSGSRSSSGKGFGVGFFFVSSISIRAGPDFAFFSRSFSLSGRLSFERISLASNITFFPVKILFFFSLLFLFPFFEKNGEEKERNSEY